MRKSFLPVYLLLLFFSLAESKQVSAQSCCPEFELQFPKFDCDAPDCPQGSTGAGASATMCQYSTNKMKVVPGISPGFTYVWNVTGGTINGSVLTTLSSFSSYVDVTWGNGSLGTVKVTIFNSDSSCFKVLTQQFCLTKSPKALFIKNTGDTVCKNQSISFTNTSLGAYTSWFWNFGDGVTQTGGMVVSHGYTDTGTYIVSLTVSNTKSQSSCGCSNTYYDTITVDNSTGLQILTPDCKKMHCAGDTVTYCSSITGCASYSWSALGGTVIGSGSCIKVVWNALSSSITNPTVSLAIPPSCAGSCGNTTSLVEKVLYNGMPIQGSNIVCVNAASTYTLPVLPGVFYTWTVTPSAMIINGTDLNTPAFGVIFPVAGTYTITCDYIDSLQNCRGTSSKTVLVRPPYSIVGPATSCVSCNSVFSTIPTGSFNWNINTPSPLTASGGGISNTWSGSQAGTWIVTATQIGTTFCNSPQQAVIIVAPKPVLTISKSASVACPGNIIKLWVTSTDKSMPITWTNPAGTQVLNNPGTIRDTIYLLFTTTGTKTVTATQFCKYSCASTSISTNITNPPIPVLVSPQTVVCIDQVVSYTVASPPPGIVYNWTITNPNLGTIKSGQGTPVVTILWHGNATNTGILKVSHCSGSLSVGITVKQPIPVSITKTGSCFSAGGYTLTANPSGQTYLWSTGATTQSINVTTPDFYWVTINPGGGGSCPQTLQMPIGPDDARLVIFPPCMVSACNLTSFSIPLTMFNVIYPLPCPSTLQWYFKPVSGTAFSPIPAATSGIYNATALGCYKLIASCANGCNVVSNTICIPDDVYFCCTTPACSNLTFGIDFNATGCNPTLFNSFYTGTGAPTGGFPVYYCYGDGASDKLSTSVSSHQYTSAGQYTACVAQKTTVFNPSTGTNDTCCINNCKTVDVPLVAGISAGYDCITGVLSMSDASTYYPTPAGATFSWSISGGSYTGSLGSSGSESVTPTSTGPFTITLSVTKGGCTSTATKIVDVMIADAAFTINPNPTCSKDITYFVTAPGYSSYYWQFGDTSYSFATPIAIPQHQYTNNSNVPTTRIVKLTVSTPDGCTSTKSQVITIHPKPIVTVTPNSSNICPRSFVLLTANVNPNGNTMCGIYNYQWMKDGVNISGATGPTYLANDFGSYSVFLSGATPACNCTMLSDTAIVKLFPDPIAHIETASTVCFDPAANPWSFNLNATNYPGYTYNWSSNNAGISFAPISSPTGATTATGILVDNTNFIIYLQVVDANGCTAYDSLCIFTYKNPQVIINASGTLCANSLNTIGVVAPNINNDYTWNNGARGSAIITALAGTYFATATSLLTGCRGTSNFVMINPGPSLQLFPIGCDTICTDTNITIPLAQQPAPGSYFVKWFDGIKPAGVIIAAGSGAITIPGNFLSLGLHHLWTTVSWPGGCGDSSGIYDVFVKKCCTCVGSSWAFRQYSIDNGATFHNWVCGNEEIGIGCNPLMINAAYNCSPGGCAGTVTGQLLDNLGNVILNIPSLPYTYTPVPGTSGNFFLKLTGWCDGVKCDSCTRQVFYNCPLPEPPCGCDTAFHFTGLPTIVIRPDGAGIVGGGTVVPMNCGTTYPNNLECQKNYKFYINHQHPWPTGSCPQMVRGEVILGGSVVYTQSNISPLTPLNYVFTGAGFYCIKFKLIVNGIVCDSCTICFNVICTPICLCTGEFHFTGNPVITANITVGPSNPNNPNVGVAYIIFPPPVVCNISLARPLMCNTSYSFYSNYVNPYTLPCVAKDSAVIVKIGLAAPLVINPNTTPGSPLNYSFTQSGTYCLKQYLKVNGIICDSCVICFLVECPTPCNCNAFAFLSNPTITFSMGAVGGMDAVSTLSSPCETSLGTELQCKRQYKFFINAGPIGAQLPAGCTYSVKATLSLNNVVQATVNNITQANPFVYTFTKEGIYCIKYELFVNGVLCKTCTQCFIVKCCSVYYTLPALQGVFVGCVIGGTTHIYNNFTGGTFRSMDTTVATVDNNGDVTAVGYGRTLIVYNWIQGPCDYYRVAQYDVPVLTPLPAITGTAVLCRTGDSTKLTNAVSGGVWTSSDPAVAPVNTGTTAIRTTYVKAISSGMATITYTVPQSGCTVRATRDVIVHNIVMEPTTGPASVCKGQTISLQNNTTVPGNFSRQWLSSSTRATVDNNGSVTGMSAGAATITYKLNYDNPAFGSCSSGSARDITVYAVPSAPSITVLVKPTFVSGTTGPICLNRPFTLKGNVAGGVWSSAGSLTVNGNGVVTPGSVGYGTVTYTVYNTSGCSSSKTVSYDVVSCELYTKGSQAYVQSKGSPTNPQQNNILPAVPVKHNGIFLYPNPTHSQVFFNIDVATGEGTVILSDMHGKELQKLPFKTGTNVLETVKYASGVYFVTFRTKHGSQTEKLVIE